MIGKPWGWKYNCAKGYVYLLFPTCELWSLSLRHRTQILYLADISRIIFELNLSPGSIVWPLPQLPCLQHECCRHEAVRESYGIGSHTQVRTFEYGQVAQLCAADGGEGG